MLHPTWLQHHNIAHSDVYKMPNFQVLDQPEKNTQGGTHQLISLLHQQHKLVVFTQAIMQLDVIALASNGYLRKYTNFFWNRMNERFDNWVWTDHRHKRIDRLLIGTAHLPRFRWAVMLPHCLAYFSVALVVYEFLAIMWFFKK
jgi:hypothetical protein